MQTVDLDKETIDDKRFLALLVGCIVQSMMDKNTKEQVVTLFHKNHQFVEFSFQEIARCEEFVQVKINIENTKHESESPRDVPKGYH